MKLKKLLLMAAFAGTACTTLFTNHAEASKLDTYRDLLRNKNYTIKYVDITPQTQERKTNKNREHLSVYGKSGMDVSKSSFFDNKPTESIVVAKGEDRYEEIGYGKFVQCRLDKGNERFNFTKYDNNGVREIYGTKKNILSALVVNHIATTMQGQGYGSEKFTRYMNAMLPASAKAKGQPVFKYVNSGWLSNGLSYEDYSTHEGDVFEAVRYYFNQYALVKIAAARYWRNQKTGVLEGTKTIIKINEFSPTPDESYLNLPEGVKISKKKK